MKTIKKKTTNKKLVKWLTDILGEQKLRTYPPVILDYCRFQIMQAEECLRKASPDYHIQPWNDFQTYGGNPIKFLIECDKGFLDLNRILPEKELDMFLNNKNFSGLYPSNGISKKLNSQYRRR